MKILPPVPDPLSPAESREWMRLLKIASGDKVQSLLDLLHVSRSTWYRWEDYPPQQWWYREVFRVVLELHVNQMRKLLAASRQSWRTDGLKMRIKKIEKGLSSLPSERYFTNQQNTALSPQFRRAIKLLQRHMKPGVKHSGQELIELARDDGISIRTISRAADDLGVVKGRDGFQGKSWWRLPESE